MNVAASVHDVQAARGRENLATTRVYVDRIRVQEDRYGATLDEVYELSEREGQNGYDRSQARPSADVDGRASSSGLPHAL